MHGPFPADNTPLLVGENPSNNLIQAFKVADPIPTGKQSNQKRNRHAKAWVNLFVSPAETISD
ncbi:hypothetical protein RIVM261_041900 [Rivularia sp. IAM M-261]|nr:hypothetical protein RIVM261_041900 [Rivularia sp. IAM M-261]